MANEIWTGESNNSSVLRFALVMGGAGLPRMQVTPFFPREPVVTENEPRSLDLISPSGGGKWPGKISEGSKV